LEVRPITQGLNPGWAPRFLRGLPSAPPLGGHEIDVSPADVANTTFDVGTLRGTDTDRPIPAG
jgi:hypothetical protein